MVGVLLGAFVRAISVWWAFYWELLFERAQYGGCFICGFYYSDLCIVDLLLGAFIRELSVWRMFYLWLLL